MVLYEKYLELLHNDLELLKRVVNGATIHVSELDPARESAASDARLLESLELDPDETTYFDLACHRLAAAGTADNYDEARLSLLRSSANALDRLERSLTTYGKVLSGEVTPDGPETGHCGGQ